MPVRILTGRPRRLMPRVLREVGEAYAAGGRCLLLVPEQYTLQAELDLVKALDLPGFFDLEVLSPTRLQHRVFELAGSPQRVRIDGRGKRMMLRCALEEMGEELSFYRRAASRAGFVDKLAEIIADLKRGAVSPEHLLQISGELAEGNALRAKLEDIARVYAAYERRMAGRFVDGEDVERAMLERLPASALFAGVRVWVTGFDMLTESFSRTLAAAGAQAESLCVALALDGGPGCRDAALFEPVSRSVQRFERMLEEAGVAHARELVDAPLTAGKAIAHLERELYAYPVHPMHEDPAGLSLHAAATPYAEAQKAAAQILAWVRDEGFAWRDIAVQYTDAGAYAGILRHVFALYGIPAYIDEKAPAGRHPLIAGLLAALRCATQGYAHEDAMLYLKSGFSGLTEAEGFALERYAVEQGLRGARWKQRLSRGKEEWIERIEPLRARFAEPLSEMQEALRRARDADGTLRAIVAFLQRIGAFEKLERYGAALASAGMPAEAAHSAQIWAHLMETLDQMHALLDGHRGTAEAVVDMLTDGLMEAELGALPPSPDALMCGMLGRVRTGRIRALVVLGLGDGKIGAAEPSLLADEERRQAERLGDAYLGMDAAARAQFARLDVLQTLTLPEERLWLSYPLADMSGAVQRPATVCAQLRRIFPALQVQGDAADGTAELCAAPLAALHALGPALREAYERAALPGAAAIGALTWLRGQPMWRGRLENVIAGFSASVDTQARLSMPAPSASMRSSVSRLESFAACPYQYFVQHVLKPHPFEPYGVRPNALGTIYHAAIERFTQTAMSAPGWPELSRAQCDALMDEALSPILAQERFGSLSEDAQARAIAERVRATAKRAGWTMTAQLQGGTFRPEGLEISFGEGEGTPNFIVPLRGGGSLYLHGRIDRLDAWREGSETFLRVVDYKSSKVTPKLDGARLYHGLQQQLPIYLASALEAHPQAQPAGMFYFRVDDPLIATRERDSQRVEAEIQKKLSMQGVLLEDLAVVRALGRGDLITRAEALEKRAPSATPQQMRRLLGHAQHKAAQMAERILSGDIGVAPVALGAWHACKYCDYASICGIDPLLPGGRPRELKNIGMAALHEILEQESEKGE